VGILITDTTLRDAHQSLIATRMRTRDMLPIVSRLDAVGFFSLEVWGGATYDSCIRFLNEDPWERLKEIRVRAKNTRLQMLLRGQNLVGYRHYADDVVREFIRLSVKNGVDVFRIFDALNDIRNMESSIKFAKECHAHVQGTICYTTSPVHTIERFASMALELAELGCDSLCIKDMAGLITPSAVAELVSAIKKRVNLPLDLHSHCSSGMAPMSYYAAVTAGVDILDTAFSAFSWGTSQPPTESIAAALKDTPYDTGLDLHLLYEIGEFFATLAEKYAPLLSSEATRPNINVLLHQIPGGMISNLVSQLREQNALDKLGEVIEEIPRVRADLGYPPLVTPTSQLVGIQAVLNVLSRKRYKQVTQETKSYLLGHYGQPPGEVNEEIRSLVIGGEKPISVRPADLIAPELEKLAGDGRKLGIIHKEEDLITYALYPQVAVKFLRGELNEEKMPVANADETPAPAAINFPLEFSVDVDGEVFDVKVSSVAGKTIEVEREKKQPKQLPAGAITSPVQGMLQSIKVKIGAHVEKGDVLAVIEAMKMQNEVSAISSGVVAEILAYESELVNNGDVLMVVIPDDK
jgi:pyruvate carboxylase subunit B